MRTLLVGVGFYQSRIVNTNGRIRKTPASAGVRWLRRNSTVRLHCLPFQAFQAQSLGQARPVGRMRLRCLIRVVVQLDGLRLLQFADASCHRDLVGSVEIGRYIQNIPQAFSQPYRNDRSYCCAQSLLWLLAEATVVNHYRYRV